MAKESKSHPELEVSLSTHSVSLLRAAEEAETH